MSVATTTPEKNLGLVSRDRECVAPQSSAELNQQAKRIQELIERAESLPDPRARALLGECLSSVLELYGDGLSRMSELIREAEGAGTPLLERLGREPAVRGLLLIHGLHPLSLVERLREALANVRPYMHSHGGDVELLGLEQGVARLRLTGTCQSCPSSKMTLELAVRHALEEACPDLTGFAVE